MFECALLLTNSDMSLSQKKKMAHSHPFYFFQDRMTKLSQHCLFGMLLGVFFKSDVDCNPILKLTLSLRLKVLPILPTTERAQPQSSILKKCRERGLLDTRSVLLLAAFGRSIETLFI